MRFFFVSADYLLGQQSKEYVSLIIGLYKNNGSVLHVAIGLLYFRPLYPARRQDCCT